MILKLKNEENWIYKDGIIEVKKREFKNDELVQRYNQSIAESIRPEGEFARLSYGNLDMVLLNEIFYGATDYVTEQIPVESLLSCKMSLLDNTTTLIISSCKNSNENEAIVTNQQVYLLNDEGKTIERLV